ncbi:helix-turn-helix domain-containing protein [Kitasatospora cineracea]|uniref:helix-turn-helix domain-containing protein n=1 Tax=Kitasatospora cineracea TaxID=88074 RepID=UPI000F4F2596|nr:helix-turn-helix transcriptional regulator [Kitasatospora cineracea]
MDRDWEGLAAALAAARRAADMTQDELASALGVGRSTVQKLERGHAYAKVQPIHRAAARAVGWTEDSIELVLAGGDPVLASSRPSDAQALASGQQPSPVEAGVDALLDDLTARVKGALLGGQVADATAVPMGDDGSVILIWKAGADQELTTAQQRELEKKWSRIQRAAQNILAAEEQEEQ